MCSSTRAVKLPGLHRYTKELRIFSSALVAPVQGCPMLVLKIAGELDNHAGIVTRRAGKQLSQMGVVGRFQLVFNYHGTVVAPLVSYSVLTN